MTYVDIEDNLNAHPTRQSFPRLSTCSFIHFSVTRFSLPIAPSLHNIFLSPSGTCNIFTHKGSEQLVFVFHSILMFPPAFLTSVASPVHRHCFYQRQTHRVQILDRETLHRTLSHITHTTSVKVRKQVTTTSLTPISSSFPVIHDESETVAAYVRDIPSHPKSQSVERLVSELDSQDRIDHSGGSRPRVDVISQASISTQAVHSGERVRGSKKTKAILDAIQVPIVQTATFTFRSTRDCVAYKQGNYSSYQYGRYGNPTTRAVEEKLAALDNAEDCLLSSSGMSSVTTMLLALVPDGGHIVTTTDCYRRTRQFVTTVLPRMGISCTVLDPADIEGLRSVMKCRDVHLYFSELPTNPLLRVVDVPSIIAICKEYGTFSVFDTTFCTPVLFRPIDYGADLVLHSATKYLSGHQDVLAGAVVGQAALISKVRDLQAVLGGILDPNAAFLINRGLKTLALRMEAHNRNAEAVVKFLNTHPKISRVHHPMVSTHPDHATAMELFDKGFGGMLSFEIKGNGDPWSLETFEATGRFLDKLKIPYIGPSLGGCETLVEQVCLMSYFDKPLKMRRDLGITNGLVRLSCGIEDCEDLIEDLAAALHSE